MKGRMDSGGSPTERMKPIIAPAQVLSQSIRLRRPAASTLWLDRQRPFVLFKRHGRPT